MQRAVWGGWAGLRWLCCPGLCCPGWAGEGVGGWGGARGAGGRGPEQFCAAWTGKCPIGVHVQCTVGSCLPACTAHHQPRWVRGYALAITAAVCCPVRSWGRGQGRPNPHSIPHMHPRIRTQELAPQPRASRACQSVCMPEVWRCVGEDCLTPPAPPPPPGPAWAAALSPHTPPLFRPRFALLLSCAPPLNPAHIRRVERHLPPSW